MIEKASLATKILLAGSLLWVGSMVFRSDERLRKALHEIGKAKIQIEEAKVHIDNARQNLNTVKTELTKLSLASDRANTELNYLRAERERMKSSFDIMISKSTDAVANTKTNFENTKQKRLNLLQEINAMNLDREPKVALMILTKN